MPDYLPLCTFRQDLLPPACRSCAWWFDSGAPPDSRASAYSLRREWMSALEPAWGSTGLVLPDDPPPGDPSALAAKVSVHYAPAQSVPRLRDLPLGPIPADAALLFCLRAEGSGDITAARRLVQKALAQLRLRGVTEVYAYAALTGGAGGGDRCEFFAYDFLDSCGFRRVRDNGDLFLMRVDLRGLATVMGRVEAVLKRVVGTDPTPSPAAWTHQGQ